MEVRDNPVSNSKKAPKSRIFGAFCLPNECSNDIIKEEKVEKRRRLKTWVN